jgi:phosphatidylserine decarboxylase
MAKTEPSCPRVVDRRTGATFDEQVLGGRLLQVAYGSGLRPFVRALLMRSGLLSSLLGWYSRTRRSQKNIRRTIDQLAIDEREFLEPTASYQSFHDFFVRRLKADCRPWDHNDGVFCSPADARLTVIQRMDGYRAVPVKGCTFDVVGLLKREDLALGFADGTALVFRLCPADYHRFHFPTGGTVAERYEISGRYDSVNPLALELGLPVFVENRRVVSLLDLDTFGRCVFVEVAAFGVGGITETHRGDRFEKLDEKGFFHYGSSTLVLLLARNTLRVDPDLVFNSSEGLETLVRVGETLGRAVSRV